MYGNISKAMLLFLRKKVWKMRSDKVVENRKKEVEAIKMFSHINRIGMPFFPELEFSLTHLSENPYVKEKNFPIW